MIEGAGAPEGLSSSWWPASGLAPRALAGSPERCGGVAAGRHPLSGSDHPQPGAPRRTHRGPVQADRPSMPGHHGCRELGARNLHRDAHRTVTTIHGHHLLYPTRNPPGMRHGRSGVTRSSTVARSLPRAAKDRQWLCREGLAGRQRSAIVSGTLGEDSCRGRRPLVHRPPRCCRLMSSTVPAPG